MTSQQIILSHSILGRINTSLSFLALQADAKEKFSQLKSIVTRSSS
jgi:hypothetical protein